MYTPMLILKYIVLYKYKTLDKVIHVAYTKQNSVADYSQSFVHLTNSWQFNSMPITDWHWSRILCQ